MSDLRMELIQGQLNDIEENVRSIKATWGNTIMTLDNIKSSLKADRQKAIEEAYQKGFEAGQHEATTLEYQQGLNDAWEAITKIAKMPGGEREKVFGDTWLSNILNKYSVSEIINILDGHEPEQDEIKVGDEVMSNNAISDHTGVVLALSPGENSAKVLENDGSMAWVAVNVLIKTGRHFNFLTPLLNEMKEGAE